MVEALKAIVEKRKQSGSEESIGMVECDEVTVRSRISLEITDGDNSNSKEPLPLSAFVTLVCFFMQVAALVHVEIVKQTRLRPKMHFLSHCLSFLTSGLLCIEVFVRWMS